MTRSMAWLHSQEATGRPGRSSGVQQWGSVSSFADWFIERYPGLLWNGDDGTLVLRGTGSAMGLDRARGKALKTRKASQKMVAEAQA